MATPQSTTAGTPTASPSGPYAPRPHTHGAGALPRQEPLYDAINVNANGQLIALYNAATTPGSFASNNVSEVTITKAVQNNDNPNDEGLKKAQQFLAQGKITQQEYDKITKDVAPKGPGVAPVAVTVKGKDGFAFTGDAFQLSTVLTNGGTTLGDMINKVTFPRTINQLKECYPGMTPAQVVSNLSGLAVNIWEPLKKQYPKAFMTNSFRHGASIGGGQHGTGQAMDVQFRGVNKLDYFDIAVWMSKNLPYDQLLLEYLPGKTVWIHVSYAIPNIPYGGIWISKNKPQNRLATLNGAAGGKFVVNLHKDIIANSGARDIPAA